MPLWAFSARLLLPLDVQTGFFSVLLIQTQNGQHRYKVEMDQRWTADETLWDIPVQPDKKAMKQDGTTIVVGELYDGIAKRFGEDAKAFKSELERMVATHYAFIIDKGFRVKINGDSVNPHETRLIFDRTVGGKRSAVIRPFVFRTTTDEGVNVFLAVGFTRPIPSVDEIAKEQEETKYSSLDAGWTILCNDRAVLYCDRSELTGLVEAGVPRYHTQFTAISGIVEFKASDASKLPTTTTKRGIDASSTLYLQIKNKMREGMRLFTDYTNKWKGRADESKEHILAGGPLSLEEIKEETKKLSLSPTTKSIPRGDQYKPNLPLPKAVEPRMRRIAFARKAEEVRAVAEYLLKDAEAEPSEVGGKCFDLFLRESRK